MKRMFTDFARRKNTACPPLAQSVEVMGQCAHPIPRISRDPNLIRSVRELAKPRTMAGKTSRESDGNLVNVGNFDDTGANVNRNNPDNRNDNLGVSFSRSVPRLRGGVFRTLDPSAGHLADLDDLLGQRCESGIVNALRFVRESQMGREHLGLYIRLVEYEKPRCALFALCEIKRFNQIENGRLDSRAERVPRRLWELQHSIVRGKIQLIHLMKNNRLGKSIGINGGHDNLFEQIISKENIFAAWREFQKGKMGKEDVLNFAEHFEEHLLLLHADLVAGRYKHGPYTRFLICDPKQRNIAKASVRDRVLHHAICRVITPNFDRAFVFDAYSSRKTKGVHRAIERFQHLAQKLSRNNTQTVWALKCDVRKFFDSVGHDRLLGLCAKRVRDDKVMALLADILGSFETKLDNGIPLGNLTSQLFANIYLDRLDQYVKRELRVKNYLRYTDDFVLLSRDRSELERVLPLIRDFLLQDLGLDLHPTKVFFRKWHQGVDFLGYGHFPHYRVLRTKTKKRMIRKLRNQREEFEAGAVDEDGLRQTIASYLGVLSHSRNRGLAKQIRLDFLPNASPNKS